MEFKISFPELDEVVRVAVESSMIDKQSKLFGWKYFTLKETAELLQIKTTTLLDKRMPYLLELEYSQSGKLFWFTKDSVEKFISSRTIKKYKR
jgi:hypothetical protein